jgi:hypothetical protein
VLEKGGGGNNESKGKIENFEKNTRKESNRCGKKIVR